MLLQPRKFKFKSKFKNRRLRMNINVKTGKLRFGSTGIQLTSQLRLNSRKIFRIKLFLKKSIKRSEDTRRKVYLNIFPHLPLTKKVLGSRMGKGKGKLSL